MFIIPLQMSDFKMKITVSYVKKYLVRAWAEFMQWCFNNFRENRVAIMEFRLLYCGC